MDIHSYWQHTLAQNAEEMRAFFHPEAYINWHNTNEHFTVEEFIRANCEYPGRWQGEMERLEVRGDLYICVLHVFSETEALHFHVTSFIQCREDYIFSIDEYWGDDGPAPQWRQALGLGRPIR